MDAAELTRRLERLEAKLDALLEAGRETRQDAAVHSALCDAERVELKADVALARDVAMRAEPAAAQALRASARAQVTAEEAASKADRASTRLWKMAVLAAASGSFGAGAVEILRTVF